MVRPGSGRKASGDHGGSQPPGRRRHGSGHRLDLRGLVTVELAVSILAAGLLLTMLCWAVFVVLVQVRCIDAASEIARQAARGDDAAVAEAKRKAPDGATFSVRRDRDRVVVVVATSTQPFQRRLPVIRLQASAEAVAEPGEAGTR